MLYIKKSYEMNFDKTLSFTNTSNMSTPIPFKIGQPVQNLPTLVLPADSYAENFDLSLLPQDLYTSSENIPTTVQQYSGNQVGIQISLSHQTTPHIKIEQSWTYSAKNANNDVKQEQTNINVPYKKLNCHQQQLLYTTKTQNQLIPPPAYPQLYPSPQSSPAQSEYAYSQQSHNNTPYDSLSSSRTSLYAASPSPSLDMQSIKQELHILPPSPPESNCEAPSPHSACSDIKTEILDAEVEAFVDLNSLFEKSHNVYCHLGTNLPNLSAHTLPVDIRNQQEHQQDNQVLREYLEDTSFQCKHNFKPLALDSFIGGLEAVRGDIEPVISLALEHAKREAEAMCAQLQISKDPCAWSTQQVHAWLRSTTTQFELPQIIDLETKFNENGAALLLLTEEEFARRAPQSGSVLHAQLDIWKIAFSDYDPLRSNFEMVKSESNTNNNWSNGCASNTNMDTEEDSEDEDETLPESTTSVGIAANMPATSTNNAEPKRRTGGSHIHLWQFLKELLSAPHMNGTAIRWIDRSKGIFKIEDSVRVAKLWGRRKNRPAMNYDKLSRSIRQYYKKGIMKKTERSQRLVYQFCQPYHL